MICISQKWPQDQDKGEDSEAPRTRAARHPHLPHWTPSNSSPAKPGGMWPVD